MSAGPLWRLLIRSNTSPWLPWQTMQVIMATSMQDGQFRALYTYLLRTACLMSSCKLAVPCLQSAPQKYCEQLRMLRTEHGACVGETVVLAYDGLTCRGFLRESCGHSMGRPPHACCQPLRSLPVDASVAGQPAGQRARVGQPCHQPHVSWGKTGASSRIVT